MPLSQGGVPGWAMQHCRQWDTSLPTRDSGALRSWRCGFPTESRHTGSASTPAPGMALPAPVWQSFLWHSSSTQHNFPPTHTAPSVPGLNLEELRLPLSQAVSAGKWMASAPQGSAPARWVQCVQGKVVPSDRVTPEKTTPGWSKQCSAGCWGRQRPNLPALSVGSHRAASKCA